MISASSKAPTTECAKSKLEYDGQPKKVRGRDFLLRLDLVQQEDQGDVGTYVFAPASFLTLPIGTRCSLLGTD